MSDLDDYRAEQDEPDIACPACRLWLADEWDLCSHDSPVCPSCCTRTCESETP